MLIKIAFLLLVALAVLGVVFRARFPPLGRGRKVQKLPPGPAKCPKCDRHLIGKASCPCAKGA